MTHQKFSDTWKKKLETQVDHRMCPGGCCEQSHEHKQRSMWLRNTKCSMACCEQPKLHSWVFSRSFQCSLASKQKHAHKDKITFPSLVQTLLCLSRRTWCEEFGSWVAKLGNKSLVLELPSLASTVWFLMCQAWRVQFGSCSANLVRTVWFLSCQASLPSCNLQSPSLANSGSVLSLPSLAYAVSVLSFRAWQTQ